MSLQVWLPLTDDLKQQGLSGSSISGTNVAINSNGKLGNCYSFNGNNSYLLSNSSPFSNATDDWSYACWFKPNNQHQGCLFSDRVEVDTTGMAIFYYQSQLFFDDGGRWQFTPSKAIAVGSWNHLVFIRQKGVGKKFYLNGELINSTNITNNQTKVSSSNYMIGASQYTSNSASGNCLNGYLNDIRIYDHALSPLEVKHLAQGLVLHYPLNRGGFGADNLILTSQYVTSGGNANGITRTYEQDGTMKIVSTSGNGHWASLGFASNSNTNVGNNLSVGDTYTISVDVKVTSGTSLPTLFINNGNSYKQLNGDIKLGQWIRAYYTSTWQEPGTTYGNISLHLGFSNAIGTYYFKNFKLEKNSSPTPWTPAPSDALYSQLGLDNNIEYDVSGYGNNGTRVGTLNWSSNSPKYNTSLDITTDSCARYIYSPAQTQLINEITLSCWLYQTSVTATSGGNSTTLQFAVSQGRDYLNLGFSIVVVNGKPGVFAGNGGSESGARVNLVSNNTITNGWHHVSATYNNGALKLYIDGQLDRETTVGVLDYVDAPVFAVGKMAHGYTNSAYYFPFIGYISDVRVYATALSANDVMALYKNAGYVDSDGNVYAYEMVE